MSVSSSFLATPKISPCHVVASCVAKVHISFKILMERMESQIPYRCLPSRTGGCCMHHAYFGLPPIFIMHFGSSGQLLFECGFDLVHGCYHLES